ncbi:MAG: FAD-dependent oxidoreductase [Acidimicrobiia bacterium]
MTDRTDIVVVGAGVAGLVAAATAAVEGQRVVVLDGHPVGGRARSSVQQGFTLNHGGHALYRVGAFRRELARLGIAPTGRSPATDGALVSRAGELHRLPTNARTLMRTTALGFRGRIAATMFLTALPRMDPGALVGRSVREWLADLPADTAAIVELLVRLSTYTDAPEQFDAGAAATQLQLGLAGVTYVDDGWQSIVEALRTVVTCNGGEIAEGHEVSSVAVDRGSVVVGVGDRELVARAVVLAAGGPGVAARLLGAPVPGADRLGPVVEASAFDLAMPTHAGPVAPLVLGLDRPLYLSVHAPVARLAPVGQTLVSVMKYLPPGVPRAGAGEDRRELLDHAVLSGIRLDDLVLERFLRAAVVHHGVPLARSGGLAGRPAVAAPAEIGLPGVFLAGDWVGAEGMLADAAAASGALAAGLALRHSAEVAA